jgi:hypothetical protein
MAFMNITTTKTCEEHGEAPHYVTLVPDHINDDGSVSEWLTCWDCAKCEWEQANHATLVFGGDIDYPEWWSQDSSTAGATK